MSSISEKIATCLNLKPATCSSFITNITYLFILVICVILAYMLASHNATKKKSDK